MVAITSILVSVLLSATPALGAVNRRANAYAPISATCPTTSLVRPASGLSAGEETYRVARKAVADVALKAWLVKTSSAFGTADLPTVALTTSGGGYRSLLSGAGVVQALDSRDSTAATAGLYQAMTYQAGLSGGSWMMSSMVGNNWPTISSLMSSLWEVSFRDSLLLPSFLLAFVSYAKIVANIVTKDAAGYDVSLTDIWGRLLGYQLLSGTDGGAGVTMSSVTSLSSFTSYAVPYPIITALGAKVWDGECAPGPNGTTYEFHPYEFGSWDKDVSAFTPMKYLGTAMSNGKPTGTTCTTNFDNLGLILGTSSSLFNQACADAPDFTNWAGTIESDLENILDVVHEVTTSDLYGSYPNPFYNYKSSTGTVNAQNNVAGQVNLALVDGGEALQNNPLFPLLQPARNIDVILVNDNSADISGTNFPNGSEILTTYTQAINNAGLTRMPYIPSVDTFVSQGLNVNATFFGCGDSSVITIIYLPNAAYTYASGTATSKLEYSVAETKAMVANGNEIATQGGKADWPVCLGCAIMEKSGQALPAACTACFAEYCYYK